jgi:hypothetical protein
MREPVFIVTYDNTVHKFKGWDNISWVDLDNKQHGYFGARVAVKGKSYDNFISDSAIKLLVYGRN